MTKDVIELAREAGFGSYADQAANLFHQYAALVAARERERVAQEFDRRARPMSGWYESNEPAEIIRALNTEGEGNDRPTQA